MGTEKVFVTSAQEHPELVLLIGDLEAINKQAQTQFDFLTKQAENMSQELGKAKKDAWKKIEDFLVEKKLIEEKHTNSPYNLHYNSKNQIMLSKKDEDDGLPDFLKKLLKH